MTNEFENLNEKTTSDNTNSTVDNTTENTADVTPIENENNQETELFENTNNVTNDNILDTDDTNNEADVQNDILNSDNLTAEDETFTSDNAPKEPKYSYKKGIALGLAGVLLCGGSLGFCLGLGLNTSKAITNAITGGFSFSNSSENKTTSAQATASNLVASEDSIAKVVSSVENSIVNISIKAQSATNWLGQTYESEGSGSGIIYKIDGDTVYIITNNHVVESANSVTVSVTGNEQVNAKLVGKDASSDLAVISVSKADLNKAGVANVTAAKFGNSDNMKVGENVIAIGNALGQGKTATLGIISAQNKEINIDGKKLTVIQTDAAINPGNSGGALVNTAGEVIGINTAKLSSDAVEGTGYSIPISSAQTIIQTLMTNGTIDKPYLGIQGYTIDENFEKIYGINIPGVFISKIESNSAAEKAGLQVSDIITAIDNTAVADIETLSKEISKHKSNDKVTFTIIRNGSQQMTVTATLQNQNEQF
ncbi:MAG: trypsin-like peptidase domain-containing protein [Lachnospirales bacterium]